MAFQFSHKSKYIQGAEKRISKNDRARDWSITKLGLLLVIGKRQSDFTTVRASSHKKLPLLAWHWLNIKLYWQLHCSTLPNHLHLNKTVRRPNMNAWPHQIHSVRQQFVVLKQYWKVYTPTVYYGTIFSCSLSNSAFFISLFLNVPCTVFFRSYCTLTCQKLNAVSVKIGPLWDTAPGTCDCNLISVTKGHCLS